MNCSFFGGIAPEMLKGQFKLHTKVKDIQWKCSVKELYLSGLILLLSPVYIFNIFVIYMNQKLPRVFSSNYTVIEDIEMHCSVLLPLPKGKAVEGGYGNGLCPTIHLSVITLLSRS